MSQTWRLIAVTAAVTVTGFLGACNTEPKGLIDTWIEVTSPSREFGLGFARSYTETRRSGEFYSITSGWYEITADSLVLHPARTVSRTSPYGSMERIDLPATRRAYGLELRGDTLLRSYISAPFDAPILTIERYERR
jgi:hypothetical protein